MIDITHKEIEESDTICIDGIEFQKVKHGEWIPHNLKPHPVPWGYDCSVCGEWFVIGMDYILRYHFCPHCGARMDGKDDAT